jgi:type IV pilus assembly protein PilO
MSYFDIDFKSLEFDSIGSWPLVLRRFVFFLIFFIVLVIGYFQDISGLMDNYSEQRTKIESLKERYEDAHNKVSNLNAYKEQMKSIQKIFDTLKRQLPTMRSDTNNDAALLEEISQQSFISGLKFKYMKPNPIEEKGFYIEYPIELAVSGTYHNIGEFVSNISNMPRIVTFHDFTLTLDQAPVPDPNMPSVQNLSDPELAMNIKAKTYWATNSLE